MTRAHPYALVLFLLLCAWPSLGRSAAAQEQPASRRTWWPDPESGLMWTGAPLAYGRTQAEAAAACGALTLQGYTDGICPGLNEFLSAARVDMVQAYYGHKVEPWGVAPGPDYSAPSGKVPSYTFKFRDQWAWYWTRTPASAAQQFWVMDFPNRPTPRDARKGFDVMCVRPMESDLLQLALQARPSLPVQGLSQLQALALLATSEAELAAGKPQAAVQDAQRALTLDPGSAQAYRDLGQGYAAQKQWPDAIIALKKAAKLDTPGWTSARFDLKRAEKAQKAYAGD